VPATRRQTREQGSLGSLCVKMKWLRVELARERIDLLLGDHVRVAGEALSNMQIVEVEAFRRSCDLGFTHATLR